MTPALARSIERLYTTFAGYPLESPSPCPTCYPAADVQRIERRLRTMPLRLLTLDDLSHFYADGVLTWGGVDDLRHLLPRLMELFAAYHLGDDVEWHGDEVTLRMDLGPDIALLRFVDAEWWTWPEVERAAVDAFFRALWAECLRQEGGELEPGVWVEEDLPEAILRLAPDPGPYLEHWRGSGWPGTRHLAWFVANDHLTSWLTWEDGERPSTLPNWEAVRRWLDEPATATQLEEAACASAPRGMAWEALLGLEALERGRASLPFSGGSWLWDSASLARAQALGVMLPPRPDDRPASE